MTTTTGNGARMFTCPMTMNGEPATEEGFSGSRCNGENCMAWRWLIGDTQIPDGKNGFRFPKAGDGYCGLAGKP